MGLRVAFAFLASATLIPATPAAPDAFLRTRFALSIDDVQAVRHGRVIARTLPASDDREVALLGVVRVPVAPAEYASQMESLRLLRGNENLIAARLLPSPATPADLKALTLDADDRGRLRRCHVGDCGVRLPEGALERFRDTVPWGTPRATREADTVMRQVIGDIAARYRRDGTQPTYVDHGHRLSVAAEFQDLAASDLVVLPAFPSLRRTLLRSSPDGVVADRLYWMRARMGPRRVITLTHLTIARTDQDAPVDYVAASRQIYADYYFDASLGLTLLVGDGSDASPATIVVYVNRSRVNAFTGVFGGITRRIVRGRARSALERHLTALPALVRDLREAQDF